MLLAAVLAALIIFMVMPLFRMKMKYTLPAGKTKPVQMEEATTEKGQSPSPLDYVIIGEANLFHPERKIPPEKKEEKALPKPELVLYGTIIDDKLSIAYVEDKKNQKTTPGRGKRQTAAKKGDVFSGFILKEIEADKIVLTRGEESMTVFLTEAGKQRGGESGQGRPSGVVTPGTRAATAAPSAFQAPRATVPQAPTPPVAVGSPDSRAPQTSAPNPSVPAHLQRRGRMGSYPPGVQQAQ